MYRQFHTSFWIDPKISRLSKDAKYLAAYLVCNPHTHMSGLYYLPLQVIAMQTKLDLDTIQAAIQELNSVEFAYYDAENVLVWVKNMRRYQAKGQKNLVGCAKQVQIFKHSPLAEGYLKHYPDVAAYMRPIPIPHAEGILEGIRPLEKGVRRGVKEQEQEQEQEKSTYSFSGDSRTAPTEEHASKEFASRTSRVPFLKNLKNDPEEKKSTTPNSAFDEWWLTWSSSPVRDVLGGSSPGSKRRAAELWPGEIDATDDPRFQRILDATQRFLGDRQRNSTLVPSGWKFLQDHLAEWLERGPTPQPVAPRKLCEANDCARVAVYLDRWCESCYAAQA